MDYENDYGWVRPYLGVDEYVLWSGKPGEGHLLAPNDVFLIPFSILWCGFAIFLGNNGFICKRAADFQAFWYPVCADRTVHNDRKVHL